MDGASRGRGGWLQHAHSGEVAGSLPRGRPRAARSFFAGHPERAEEALIASPDDSDVLVTYVALRSIAPALNLFALVQSPKIAQALRDLGVGRTLASGELVAHTLAKSPEAPHAGDLLLRLIGSERYRLAELTVDPAVVGVAPRDVMLDPPAIIFGVLRDGEVAPVVAASPQLKQGDVLITLAARAAA